MVAGWPGVSTPAELRSKVDRGKTRITVGVAGAGWISGAWELVTPAGMVLAWATGEQIEGAGAGASGRDRCGAGDAGGISDLRILRSPIKEIPGRTMQGALYIRGKG